MGLYNSLIVKCPYCSLEIELQTKSGECHLEYKKLNEDNYYDLFFTGKHYCWECRKWFELKNINEPNVIIKKL